MIGGDDLFLEGQPSWPDDVDIIVRYMRRIWPHGVARIPPAVATIPLRALSPRGLPMASEIFVYRDEQARATWQRDGLTDDNASAMIWISVDEDGLAFVMDDRDSPSGQIVRELITAIRNDWRLRKELTKEMAA